MAESMLFLYLNHNKAAMKGIKIIFLAIFTGLLPFSLASGQDKKNEEKVKIVIVDDSGKRTVVDTTLMCDKAIDSLRLKDGSIFYIGKTPPDDGDNVFIYNNTEDHKSGKGTHYKVITHVNKDSKNSVMKYVYVNADKNNNQNNGETFDVRVSDDEPGGNSDQTKYVIAKDGIVVSVEGADDQKVKELVKEIESKLGIDKGSEAQSVRKK